MHSRLAIIRRCNRHHYCRRVCLASGNQRLGQALEEGPLTTHTRLSGRVEAILKRAEDAGADDTALKAVAELRRQIELAARILGDLDATSKTTVIIAEHPEWLRVRDILFTVLDRHPAAKADFIATAKELAVGRP